MNRRTTLTLTGVALLGLALGALPQLASGQQSDPRIGTWKLNLAKSKYSPGPPPRSNTAIWEAVGQGVRVTAEGIDAQGNPMKAVFGPNFSDGKSYPITGSPAYDAASSKRVNASTFESTRTKDGRDRKSTRLNSSHVAISYAVFCLKKKKKFRVAEMTLLRQRDSHH